MSVQAPVAPSNNTPQTKRPLVVPDERFWQRYSPRGEVPLSTVASVAAHVLVLAFLIFGITFLGKLFNWTDRESVAVEAIEVLPGGTGPAGTPDGDNKPVGGPQEGVTTEPDPALLNDLPPVEKLADLERPKVDPAEIIQIIPPNSDGERFIDNLSVLSMSKVDKDARDKLMAGLASRDADKTTKGGNGTGKGPGEGKGPKGVGGDDNPVGPKLSARQKRVCRWTMLFDENGEIYRMQLIALGATTLGIPEPDPSDPKKVHYRIVRNLTQRPVQGDIEDVSKMKQFYWVDDRAKALASLAGALGLPRTPPYLIILFPQALEDKLLRRELAFARGKKEHEIQETRFRVVKTGGSFEPMVIDQR